MAESIGGYKMLKISFGMIVFNAQSTLPTNMLSACLSNIYDIAHEILISEGAVRPHGGNNGDATWATSDGRSTDGTLEFLRNFPDPDNKIKIFTKEGFWNGKLEMCNAYAKDATGDYVWQIDSDEFYKKSDMRKVIDCLEENRHIDAVHFYANHFWGDWEHCCDETHGMSWANQIPWMRIFKNSPGSSWKSHAPPIYQDKHGVLMNRVVWDRDNTLKLGIKLYHYGYVVKSQTDFKEKYYKNNTLSNLWQKWQLDKDTRLINGDQSTPFTSTHPEIIYKLIEDN
jgi:glycosyltransferase involved in cell wall biosynthesis